MIGAYLWGQDVLFKEALWDRFLQVVLEVSIVDGLVPLTVMVRKYSLTLESVGSYWIGFRHLTHGWSLMSLKSSLTGSLRGVKCCSILKAWGGISERTDNACLL